MKVSDWERIRYFHAGEAWGNWQEMSFEFVKLLDDVRTQADTPFFLTSPAWTKKTGHSSTSYHYLGRAADFRLPKKSTWFAYNLIVGTLKEMGIYNKVGFGFYPYGAPSFFHLDDRACYPGFNYEPGVVWVRPDESKPSEYLYNAEALAFIERIRIQGAGQ